MSSKHFTAFLVSIIVPFSAFCQTASQTPNNALSHSSSILPETSAPDAAELTQLLKDFLAGASRNDLAMHERFWADDVIYTSSSGKRRGKPEILADVRKAAASTDTKEKTIYTAEDVRIQQYGTTAIVAFRLIGTTTEGDKTETGQYLNTGTFLNRDGKWQVVAWQATKIPQEKS